MKKFTYTITDLEGIHARPAGRLVKLAAGFASDIKIEKDGVSMDAKRIFGVMGLGAKAGQEVVFTAEGSDEDDAIVEIETFMKENL
ncbi:MAG: HPr family phosphocarrier protein [Mobilitalea sp.]